MSYIGPYLFPNLEHIDQNTSDYILVAVVYSTVISVFLFFRPESLISLSGNLFLYLGHKAI